MATSNIVNTLGAGSGIDIKALAESLVEAERAPRKARIDDKITQSEARISGYGAIKYALSQLKTAFETLNDASEFAAVKTSNSQPAAFGVSTGASSGTGSYSLEVTRIATEQRTASEVFASRDAAIPGGAPLSLQLTVGNGSAQNITVNTATPAGVVTAINNANLGVSARLLNTGSGFQMVLAGQTGAAQQFSLSTAQTTASSAQVHTHTDDSLVVNAETGSHQVAVSYTDASDNPVTLELVQGVDGRWRPPEGSALPPAGTALTLSAEKPVIRFDQTLQTAQDAAFKVNGLPITRSGNSVSDVIEGVTLNLFTATEGPARLELSRETGPIKDKLKALVTAYNEFNGNLKILGDAKSDVEVFGGALAGDDLLRSVREQVRRFITDPSSTPGGSIQAARHVGLSIDRNGVLQLDEAKLDQALQNQFADVVTMFTANKNNLSVYSPQSAGLAGDAVRKLDEMLRSTGGIEQKVASTQKQILAHQGELERLQDQMDKLLSRYMRQFSVMESIVGESNSLRNSLKGTFESMLSSNRN